jgi:hypothetical protein
VAADTADRLRAFLMRWEGARQPIIWTIPAPDIEPRDARLELARRYLHFFGPATPEGFAKWAGIGSREGIDAFAALADALAPVKTPIGEARILVADEASYVSPPDRVSSARLLPSGDAYFLLWGADRELLVPDADLRDLLWTSRVWPGAVLVGGEIAGTWRRDQAHVAIAPWRLLSASERDAVEAEAASLPLPNLQAPPTIEWISEQTVT